MAEAPERIWADRGPKGGWLYRDRKMPDSEHEYVRADLLAARDAEIARMTAERDARPPSAKNNEV